MLIWNTLALSCSRAIMAKNGTVSPTITAARIPAQASFVYESLTFGGTFFARNTTSPNSNGSPYNNGRATRFSDCRTIR
jgi:hypothetical protein